jgi:pimeloyl-ACP methyl ester carboxylesterase
MMKRLTTSIGLLTILLLTASPRSLAQVDAPAGHSAPVAKLLCYEPTGLSLVSPYTRGKIPVVFIHGLWSSPASWHRMIATLEDDPAIAGKCQFWTFGYSTGDPIPYSAYLLRKDLDDLRPRLDPDRSDAAFDRMVIVGHSMGGLLTRMMVVDAGDHLWRLISDRPFGELSGEEGDRRLFREGLLFAARPGVGRVIYVATPHRGSHFDRGAIHRFGTRLVRVADPLRAAHLRLVSANGPEFFREPFRKAIPTSIDELEAGSPILSGLAALPTAPVVKVHSIIAVLPGSPSDHQADGLVEYPSAHLAGAASEKVVAAGHLCQDHPEVIGEVRRILAEHVAP